MFISFLTKELEKETWLFWFTWQGSCHFIYPYPSTIWGDNKTVSLAKYAYRLHCDERYWHMHLGLKLATTLLATIRQQASNNRRQLFSSHSNWPPPPPTSVIGNHATWGWIRAGPNTLITYNNLALPLNLWMDITTCVPHTQWWFPASPS